MGSWREFERVAAGQASTASAEAAPSRTHLPCRRLRSFFSRIQSRLFFTDLPLAFLKRVLPRKQAAAEEELRYRGSVCPRGLPASIRHALCHINTASIHPAHHPCRDESGSGSTGQRVQESSSRCAGGGGCCQPQR